MKVRVKYTGPGGEIFPEYHWQPKPGDVRDIEIADDATLEGHVSLEETDEPITLVTETEIGAGADDPDEDDEDVVTDGKSTPVEEDDDEPSSKA